MAPLFPATDWTWRSMPWRSRRSGFRQPRLIDLRREKLVPRGSHGIRRKAGIAGPSRLPGRERPHRSRRSDPALRPRSSSESSQYIYVRSTRPPASLNICRSASPWSRPAPMELRITLERTRCSFSKRATAGISLERSSLPTSTGKRRSRFVERGQEVYLANDWSRQKANFIHSIEELCRH